MTDIVLGKDHTVPPLSESKVTCTVDSPFKHGLISHIEQGSCHLMDGVAKLLHDKTNDKKECCAIVLNTAHKPIHLARNTVIGKFEGLKTTSFQPIEAVLQIHKDNNVRLADTSHLAQVKLDHLPLSVKGKYQSLVREYANIFSRHDLDVGHCKTLPHTVRLTDHNKVVSVNQYRLPYHLKEVAIDYVEKLLKSGVVRPSTSVFNSPLMLVKKPKPGMRERAALLHALRHWQPYLIGKEFTLRTDHNPNLALAKGKMKSYDTLTDEILQFMPFKLEFLNGNKMFVDALSRPSSMSCAVDLGFGPSLSAPFDEQVIRTAQLKDKEFAKLFLLHKQVALPGATVYQNLPTHLYNNLLCTFTRQGKRVMLAPTKLQKLLLYLAHDQSGHQSYAYTLDRLNKDWMWPTMLTDIANYCKSCDICSRTKNPHRYVHAPLSPMKPTPFQLGDRIHLDMLSMPRSVEGHVAILTAVDAVTGFVLAKACYDKTSTNVTDMLLHQIIPYFGCPSTIITDLGVENKNAEVKQLFDQFCIKHISSSRAHPQSNGMVERRQRMLINFARLYSDTVINQNLWHFRLPMCLLILNSTKSKSSNFSPFFLTYFSHARLPYSTMLRRPLNLKEDSTVAGKLRMANTVLRMAMEKLDSNFEQNANWYMANKSFTKSFPIGCKLFVLNSQRKNVSYKLAQKWQGAFICIQHLSNNNLLIKPINENKLVKIHINNCKRAEFRNEHLRLNDDTLRQDFNILRNKPSQTPPDKLIVSNDAFDDDLPHIPDNPVVNPPSPPPPAVEEHFAESDQPDDSFASADEHFLDSTDSSDTSDHLVTPSKSSSEPNISSPETTVGTPIERSSSSGRLTRQQAKTQNIAIPTPVYQPHSAVHCLKCQ